MQPQVQPPLDLSLYVVPFLAWVVVVAAQLAVGWVALRACLTSWRYLVELVYPPRVEPIELKEIATPIPRANFHPREKATWIPRGNFEKATWLRSADFERATPIPERNFHGSFRSVEDDVEVVRDPRADDDYPDYLDDTAFRRSRELPGEAGEAWRRARRRML